MILIKGGRAINPERRIDEIRDVVLDGGIIECAGNTGGPDSASRDEEYERAIDATDPAVTPGLVDVHAYFRDPGLTYEEDIGTGAKAAAVGGFTIVVRMTNTKPPVDNVKTLSYVVEKGKKTDIHVLVDATISVGVRGQELTDMAALKAADAVGFASDGTPMMSDQLVLEAVEETIKLGVPLNFREEGPTFIRNNGTNHGAVPEKTGIYGSPSVAENILVARDCMIALYTKASINIQHMSSRHVVGVVRHVKVMGAFVIAEVMFHHFTLTEEVMLEHGILAKTNPPLCTEEDRQALIQGLKDETIDIIAADHAPHSQEEKVKPLAGASSGIIRLETALALGIAELMAEGYPTALKPMEKISPNPAKLYRLPCGRLQEGAAADLVTFDEEELWTVENGYFKPANFPPIGRQLQGKAKYTTCGGKTVYEGRKSYYTCWQTLMRLRYHKNEEEETYS